MWVICPFCIAQKIKELREQRLVNKKLAKDFWYLLPQLATIYYAGKQGLRVITDSEEPVGIPITALVSDIGLAVDVCCSSKVLSVKK